MAKLRCDIIIPVYDRHDLTKDCLNSIYECTHTDFNLILIDNASGARTRAFLDKFVASTPNARLVRNNANLGWVRAVNQGMRLSSGGYICIMNNDTIVRTDNWLHRLIEIADSEADIGLVNPNFDVKRDTLRTSKPYIEIDFCRGYCVLVKRGVMEKIGVLDEAYGSGYYDDDDYSVRAIRAGFRCVKANSVLVAHLRDSTFKAVFAEDKRNALHERNKELFYSRWGRRLRLAFAITKTRDKKKMSDLLVGLARRQHILHVWNFSGTELAIEHVNVREKLLPGFLSHPYLSAELYLNSMKRPAKQYDIVFTDDGTACPKGIGRRHNLCEVDFGKDASSIEKFVDKTAGA